MRNWQKESETYTETECVWEREQEGESVCVKWQRKKAVSQRKRRRKESDEEENIFLSALSALPWLEKHISVCVYVCVCVLVSRKPEKQAPAVF